MAANNLCTLTPISSFAISLPVSWENYTCPWTTTGGPVAIFFFLEKPCVSSQEDVYLGNFDASLSQVVRHLYLRAQESGVKS